MKKSIVFGVSGQDGSYMVEDLLSDREHLVWGVIRRNSINSKGNLSEWVLAHRNFTLVEGDITDPVFLYDLFHKAMPDYIWNLAAQSHVGTSFAMPEYTMNVTGFGAVHIMETMKRVCPEARMLQASSSEMYGNADVHEFPLTENTPLRPVSPYGAAKVLAHNMASIYRKQGLWITCTICHNHESERRGELFLTSKVIKQAARKQPVRLGNLSAVRDWGYAPEYVMGMQRALIEYDNPTDFVLATGEGHSVSEFVRTAYRRMGLDPDEFVEENVPEFMRPVELDKLVGDPSKIQGEVGWYAETDFEGLIDRLLDSETFKLRLDRIGR